MTTYHSDRDRWYHVYLYFLLTTTALCSVMGFFMEKYSHGFILGFGIAGFFQFAFFLTHLLVDGLSAKTGGSFVMLVTCIGVCKYVPF